MELLRGLWVNPRPQSLPARELSVAGAHVQRVLYDRPSIPVQQQNALPFVKISSANKAFKHFQDCMYISTGFGIEGFEPVDCRIQYAQQPGMVVPCS